ncbi:MAG: DNA topoisomerase 3 [Lachnospiraceae bacterium]|nr:DNA topoisomerase 3 [Lachnospiraceae bacterium]
MILVIAEKPSVAKSISKVIGANTRKDGYMEGNGYLVSWCLGHLAEYVEPDAYDEKYGRWNYADLPIIPEHWRLAVAPQKKEQFEVLSGLLNRPDVSCAVNGCDAGREGESIFRRVYQLSGSRVPIKRLWISSMEDSAILDGFANLKDGREYENLYQSAECRAMADWLVGMNATRAYTTVYYKRLVVGRVQTPTLALLVDRQEKIDGFVKTPYYKVSLTGGGLTVTSEDIPAETDADELVNLCQGKNAEVTRVKRVRKQTAPPKLYDLTTLQREANRFYGYTAQETLDTLQELYEMKLVTYPRTDSQYITDDMEDTVRELLFDLTEITPIINGVSVGDNVKRLINNAKVSDHHALLPTKEAAKSDLSELSECQLNILSLVAVRLAQAVSPEYVYEETQIEVMCEGHLFKAKGKKTVEDGFKAVETVLRISLKKRAANTVEKEDTAEDAVFTVQFSEGDVIPSVEVKKSQHFTSPPKLYSEDTLLSSMETAGNKEFDADTEKKGLGTPATRASIIEKLVHSGYATRKGRQIVPTKDGMELIALLPDYLKSASMTAEWENRLLSIERGETAPEDFMQGIRGLLTMMLNGCDQIPEEERRRFDERVRIGNCPICGKPVYESRTNFYCSDKSCRFALWKENRYLASMRKTVDAKMASDLLKNGKTHVKDFYSAKKDSTFEADLLMKVEDGRTVFSLSFPKNDGNRGKHKSTGKKKYSR